MKKDYILGILFFSGLWGLSEALLGGVLYKEQAPFASVPLTIIAFGILTLSRIYFPQKGTATLIAVCAMFYKFLNIPLFNTHLFVCHLLGIALIGVCFDVFFSIFDLKNKLVAAFTAVFLNYVLFAFLMTYIIRYEFWTGSSNKFLTHLGEGFIAAVGCAIVVPFMLKAGQALRSKVEMPFTLKLKPAPGMVSLATVGLWVFILCMFSLHFVNAGR